MALLMGLALQWAQAQLPASGSNKSAHSAFLTAEKRFYKGNLKGGSTTFERAAKRYEAAGSTDGYIAAKAMEAIVWLENGEPKQAFRTFRRAEELYDAQAKKNPATKAYLRLCLGKYHLYYNENQEAKTFLREAAQVAKQYPQYFSAVFELELQENLGVLYERLGNHQSALEFYESLLKKAKSLPAEDQNPELLSYYQDQIDQLYEKTPNADPKAAADRYKNLLETAPEEEQGELNFKTGRSFYKYTEYDEAYKHLTDALDQDLSDQQLAQTKAMLATIAMSIKDYDDALTQNGEALSIKLNINEGPESLYETYVQQGNIYKELETNENSEYWYKKSLKNPAPDWSLDGELEQYDLEKINYAEDEAREENFNIALLNYERAERLVNRLPRANQKPALIEIYMAKGSLYFSARAYNKAEKFYAQALELMERFYPAKHPVLAEAARYRSQIDLYQGELKTALDWVNRSLNATTYEAAPIIQGDGLPEAAQAQYPYEWLYSTAIKTQVLYQRYQQLGKATRPQLEHCLAASNLAMEMAVLLRASYRTEGAKYQLPELSQLVSHQAIQTCGDLYRSTNEVGFLHQLYHYIETSKSALLLQAVQQLRAQKITNVPDSVIAKENDLKTRIAYYSGEVYYESRRGRNMDQDRLDALEKALKEAKAAYPKYLLFIKETYPEYYAMKYAGQPVSCVQLQQRMGPNNILINYAVVDSVIHIILIDQAQVVYQTSSIKTRLRKAVSRYVASLKGDRSKDFVRYSNLWYRLLIQPIEEHLDGRPLVIIPDAELNYLPFELIPTADIGQSFASSSKVDFNQYKTLPYLLRRMPIAYNYSATLYLQALEHDYSGVPETFLGFAPDFSKPVAYGEGDVARQSRYKDLMLTPLDNATVEVKRIQALTQGQAFVGNDATESQFKAAAQSYGILHFATHGILNHKYPLYSSLVLVGDDEEDGLLHTYELYNMQLNAEMVALSACNTGVGTIKKGEGAMSVARGFAYAGCPNIAMTLWPISDQATQILMENFYIYLMRGLPKAEALQQAKLNFLDTGDGLICVPYFWSGLILVGTPDPLQSIEPVPYTPWSDYFWMISVLAVFVVLMLGFVLVKKRQA